MSKSPLVLPGNRVVDVDSGTFFFQKEVYDWSGRPVRSADHRYLPVAWSPYMLAMQLFGGYYDGILNDYYTGWAWHVPDNYYAKSKTLVRRPRVVLIAKFHVDVQDIIDPILDELNANNIFVAEASYEFGGVNTQFFRHPFLPFTGQVQVDNLLADGDIYEQFYPVLDVANWIGGEILYLNESIVVAGGGAVGLGVTLPGPTYTFTPTTDGNNAGIQLIKDAYPRYDRFGLHAVIPTQWEPGSIYTGTEGGIVAEASRIASELEDYGTTIENFVGSSSDPSFKTAAETSFRAKIVEFFDL